MAYEFPIVYESEDGTRSLDELSSNLNKVAESLNQQQQLEAEQPQARPQKQGKSGFSAGSLAGFFAGRAISNSVRNFGSLSGSRVEFKVPQYSASDFKGLVKSGNNSPSYFSRSSTPNIRSATVLSVKTDAPTSAAVPVMSYTPPRSSFTAAPMQSSMQSIPSGRSTDWTNKENSQNASKSWKIDSDKDLGSANNELRDQINRLKTGN